VFFLNKYKD